AIVESFLRTYRHFGVEAPESKSILPQIGHPLFDMFVNLGVDSADAQEYVVEYKKNYPQVHTLKTELLPGAKEAIELAHKSGARLGVVTTKTGKFAIELLEYFGVMHYFEVLVGSEDVKKHKPDAEPVVRALEVMGVTKRNSVYMIGDTCMDVQAALNAGVKGVAVEFKYSSLDELKVCSKVVKCCIFEAVKDILANKI
ncbi:MAG TPA: HAD family hydrolase, partial [Nitratifractor sp.]|nr:HAD family hydrolase [Nitratifractor sp.]